MHVTQSRTYKSRTLQTCTGRTLLYLQSLLSNKDFHLTSLCRPGANAKDAVHSWCDELNDRLLRCRSRDAANLGFARGCDGPCTPSGARGPLSSPLVGSPVWRAILSMPWSCFLFVSSSASTALSILLSSLADQMSSSFSRLLWRRAGLQWPTR